MIGMSNNTILVRNVQKWETLKAGQWNSYSIEYSTDGGATWVEGEGQGSPALGIEVVLDGDFNEVHGRIEIID